MTCCGRLFHTRDGATGNDRSITHGRKASSTNGQYRWRCRMVRYIAYLDWSSCNPPSGNSDVRPAKLGPTPIRHLHSVWIFITSAFLKRFWLKPTSTFHALSFPPSLCLSSPPRPYSPLSLIFFSPFTLSSSTPPLSPCTFLPTLPSLPPLTLNRGSNANIFHRKMENVCILLWRKLVLARIWYMKTGYLRRVLFIWHK